MSLTFCEPPTASSLEDARRALKATRISVTELSAKIDAAEAALAEVVHESRCMINDLQREHATLEDQALQTMAYLSPIRRLPTELLRNVFMWCFQDHPCCAWVLSSVCSPWRGLTLKMPKIWSKIRLVTTQHASADTIRLWIERSGHAVPLDIEIFLRVTGSEALCSRRRRRSSLSPPSSPPPWSAFPHNAGLATHYVIPHPPVTPAGPTILPSPTPVILPPSPAGLPGPWFPRYSTTEGQSANSSRSSLHWGHIVIYYLAEQMHRWERFIFRFDKQFTSMGALKSISGDAPLLREFEVSSAETAFYPEWQWLPNATPNATLVLPRLRRLTLHYAPFKWSSPLLRTNLTVLSLRALPSCQLPLDRIMYIIAHNLSLESLTLHFQGVLPAILPLAPTTLPMLDTFHIGGHFFLHQLVESLVLPALSDLTIDIDAREPIEDTISNLLTRSSNPSLRHLSVAYSSINHASSFYYGPSGVIISWTSLLVELMHLESLHVGGAPLELLLSTLALPDDETIQMTSWACPKLEVLGMRNCHTHSEWLTKLVQMVEARNPSLVPGVSGTSGAFGGLTPARLKTLELHDCASLGQDVVQWLKSRIEEVVCTEPESDR